MTIRRAILLLFVCCLSVPSSAETLTLPRDQRPEWLRKDGIVMAGSWEPLLFRVRRDGGQGYQPTPQQQADYAREHSPEMVARLKDLGVNFLMMHCYKGGGLEAERESMNDAVRFARLCHEAGLRVGVYNYSGAFIWELFFKEKPEAKDWAALDVNRQPITYGKAGYRYYWNRNHPDAEAFYQQLVRFAVNEIGADLIHFDNYSIGPGYDHVSVDRFRRYLAETFSPRQLESQGVDLRTATPPAAGAPDLVRRAWLDFSCASLAESYHRMAIFARTLRPDVLVELNPGGVRPAIVPPVDHGRLLTGGEAYWDESGRPGYQKGRLVSRIRTCKVGRTLNNTVFSYITTPLEAAESMAFNLDCLGAICWFEYGRTVERPGSTKEMSADLAPYVRFFHQRRDLLRDARVVADAAVLRSFPSQAFGDRKAAELTARVENALILGRKCFQIIYDGQLGRLEPYPALVLAGCTALADAQLDQIRRYVKSGGRLVIVGPAATHDQWMSPRTKPALDDLPPDRVVRVAANGDWFDALRHACPGGLSLSVSPSKVDAGGEPFLVERNEDAPSGLCCELTEQADRRLVHLVNYRDDGPINQVSVHVRLPGGRKAIAVTLASPEHEKDIPLEFQESDGAVAFTVPRVNVYEIAVVRLR